MYKNTNNVRKMAFHGQAIPVNLELRNVTGGGDNYTQFVPLPENKQ